MWATRALREQEVDHKSSGNVQYSRVRPSEQEVEEVEVGQKSSTVRDQKVS
jgi:hypothetical protein